MFLTDVVQQIKIFSIYILKNPAIYAAMLKNIADPERPHVKV